MKCPYCEHEFDLTWKRYWKNPRGKHTCPSCHKKSKLSYSFLYLSTVVGVLLMSYGLLSFVTGIYPFAAMSLFIFILAFTIDRWADVKFRKLVPINGELISNP